MKRILIMLLCAVGMSACLGTHYFDPEVVETSDTEEMISYLGDTCWFQVEFRQVMTKFEPGEDFKPFRYVVEIEGMETSDPVTVEHDRDFAELIEELEKKYPEFYENWRKGNGSIPKFRSGVIAFEVPANLSEAQRKVEVKVSISNGYHDTENWGEWKTAFSAVQEGYEILVDHMILDGYKVMFGEYEVSSVICFEEWMPEHLIEPATAKLQEGRSLQDGSRVCLNHDMTYSIKEDGNEISSGTYETGIYEIDTCEEMCYYYPGPRSFKGYLELTDANGNRLLFGMFIAANENSELDYGTLWPYQAFEITEGDRHIDYGIRYGLTYCE